MKVYLFYCSSEEVANDEATRSTKKRFNIPEEWLNSPCKVLLEECLPKVLPSDLEAGWRPEDFEIKCGGIILQCGDLIGKNIREYNELFIIRKKKQKTLVIPEGHVRCTNFGCGKSFDPDHNTDDACHYHCKGPVFHDLAKYWACCPDKKGFDWNEFEKIPPCQVGKHSTEERGFRFSQEKVCDFPPLASPLPEKSSSSCSSAVEVEKTAVQPELPQPSPVVDGKARCRNFGCCQEFVVAENNSTACTYHAQGPVIRDIQKFWKCCPDKKCYEFEDFVKIAGCCTGPHKL